MKIYILLSLILVSAFVSAGTKNPTAPKHGKSLQARKNISRRRQRNGHIPPISNTPLMTAIAEENVKEVTRLLEKGNSPNVRNLVGSTPLSFTLHQRPSILTELLLEHGADPNASSKGGWTELGSALAFGTEEQVILLLEHGADPFQLHKGPIQNTKLIQEKRTKRCITLLLCIEKATPELPAEMVEMIKDNMKDIVKSGN